MGLVQTAFLGGLAALAIPLIVHLLFRLRTRRVELGTLRFLGEVIKKNARRKKIKRYILLALRMAVLAILVLLFARPYLIAQGTGSAERLVTILIDASATMSLRSDGRPLVARSVAEARSMIAASGKGTSFEVALFDHEVRPIRSAGEASVDKVLAELDTSAASSSGTNYAEALTWARDVALRSDSVEKELHLFSDFQRSGLEWAEVEPVPADVKVTLHDLGRDPVNNVAVIAADMAATMVRPGDPIKVNVTVANYGPFALTDVPVKLYLQSERNNINRRQRVSLAAGAFETFEFELKSLDPALWKGFVEIEVDDELAFDNRRYTAVNVAPAWNVLVVDGQPHESDVLAETYFLQTALRLAPEGKQYEGSPYEPTVVAAEAGVPSDLDPYALVILANLSEISATGAEALAAYVESGGGLLIFTGENVTAQGYEALRRAGLSPGKLGQPRFANDLPWRIEAFESAHSIFEPLSDPQHGDLRRIAFNAYTPIQPAAEATVLASFRNGDPLLLERPHGQGNVLWFTSACDRSWSDLPRRRLFLPIVHQMLGYLTGLNEGGPVRNKLLGKDEIAETKPGVYRREQYWDVVNLIPRESDPDRVQLDDFVTRFDLNEVTSGRPSADPRLASMGPSTEELRDDEIWHWVVFTLIVLLGAEFFLANRTTA
jgi:hypothetical protein